jgi:hypothetical protein
MSIHFHYFCENILAYHLIFSESCHYEQVTHMKTNIKLIKDSLRAITVSGLFGVQMSIGWDPALLCWQKTCLRRHCPPHLLVFHANDCHLKYHPNHAWIKAAHNHLMAQVYRHLPERRRNPTQSNCVSGPDSNHVGHLQKSSTSELAACVKTTNKFRTILNLGAGVAQSV